MTDWFARPVLHVASVEASLRFYVDRLGFTVAWQFEEEGRVFVAQVDRGSCALIFSNQWPEKVSKGLNALATYTVAARASGQRRCRHS